MIEKGSGDTFAIAILLLGAATVFGISIWCAIDVIFTGG